MVSMTRAPWDAIAATYDRGRAIAGLDGWREAAARYLRRGDEAPIVDVGAGTGAFSILLAEWFETSVVAVEPERRMVDEARARRSHPRFEYREGDGANLPIESGGASAAWLSTVIHHFPDLDAAAKEVARVVRPGAPILVRSSFPGRHDEISLFHFFPAAGRVAESFPSVDRVCATFAAADCSFVALERVHQVTASSLREARDKVALRADTTLRAVSDEDFARGLAALDSAIAADVHAGPVIDGLDLLVLRRA
jgi:ubiquinone/menaquinone biosynthesis C-methylase UbiE